MNRNTVLSAWLLCFNALGAALISGCRFDSRLLSCFIAQDLTVGGKAVEVAHFPFNGTLSEKSSHVTAFGYASTISYGGSSDATTGRQGIGWTTIGSPISIPWTSLPEHIYESGIPTSVCAYFRAGIGEYPRTIAFWMLCKRSTMTICIDMGDSSRLPDFVYAISLGNVQIFGSYGENTNYNGYHPFPVMCQCSLPSSASDIWHHFTFITDLAGFLRLIVDGKQANTGWNYVVPTRNPDSTYGVWIIGSPESTPDWYISDLRVFDQPLTVAQAVSLYDGSWDP